MAVVTSTVLTHARSGTEGGDVMPKDCAKRNSHEENIVITSVNITNNINANVAIIINNNNW